MSWFQTTWCNLNKPCLSHGTTWHNLIPKHQISTSNLRGVVSGRGCCANRKRRARRASAEKSRQLAEASKIVETNQSQKSVWVKWSKKMQNPMVLLTPPLISWTNFWHQALPKFQIPFCEAPFATNFQHYRDHLANDDTAVGGAGCKQLATSEEAVEGRRKSPIPPIRIPMPENYTISVADSLPLAKELEKGLKPWTQSQKPDQKFQLWLASSITLPSIPCLRLIESLTPQKV